VRRLLAAARVDVVLQWRHGLVAAAAFVVLALVGLLHLVDRDTRALLLPALVLSSASVTTFYFVAALVLHERAQHSLEALRVTPLPHSTYVAAKTATLCLLALAEATAVVLGAWGLDVAWLQFGAGTILLAAIYVLVGLIAVAPYDSINAYIIPSALWVTLLQLPLVDHFGLLHSSLLYVWPTHGPFVLMRGGFRGIGVAEVAGAGAAGVVWVGVLARPACRALARIAGPPAPGTSGATSGRPA
jgi:fluoroquinolone transport system permease protein